MGLRFVLLIIIIMTPQIIFSQDLPDVPDVTDLGIDTDYAEAIGRTESLPDSLDDDVLTSETATQLFSYMKWLFSDVSAKELVGETLAPILINLYLLLFIGTSFTVLWLTIRFLILMWRLILFIIRWIIRLIELFPVLQ